MGESENNKKRECSISMSFLDTLHLCLKYKAGAHVCVWRMKSLAGEKIAET